MEKLYEGLDFDSIRKIVSFNPNHELRVNTGSLLEPKPIYDIFKDKSTGNKYKLISIFERKNDESGLDRNPFIYALKGESGDATNKIWKFKSNDDINKLFRRFVYITSELNQKFDTILLVPSTSDFNNKIMKYILRIIKSKNPKVELINDYLFKLDKGDVFLGINWDDIENDGINVEFAEKIIRKAFASMGSKFQYHKIPSEYRKYITETLTYTNDTLSYLPKFVDKKILVFDDTVSQGRTISETCKILIETCGVKPENIVILTLLSRLKQYRNK